MIRVERSGGRLAVVSRLARARVLGVLVAVLAVLALAAARALPSLAPVLAAAGVLLVALGGRAVHARFEGGRVRVRPAVPFQRARERRLEEFSVVGIETVADERRRKAERLARAYRARAGGEMPSWFRPPDAPGTNDHLRRIVLVPRDGDPLPVTAWLAEEDDLEPARAELQALVGGGG